MMNLVMIVSKTKQQYVEVYVIIIEWHVCGYQ